MILYNLATTIATLKTFFFIFSVQSNTTQNYIFGEIKQFVASRKDTTILEYLHKTRQDDLLNSAQFYMT